MLSFVLIILLFVYWTFIGRSILAVCINRLSIVKAWLLSPSIGLALMVFLLMLVSQAGLTLSSVSLLLTISVFFIALILFLVYRPLFPFKPLFPFIGAFLLGLIIVAWPALKLNFRWISFVTDDYVNYCLAADRFKNFGFYRLPKVEELTGRDYTQYFWFMHVPAQVRFGAEHQIAWLSTLTGLRTLQVFMPLIIALGLVQISSLAALVMSKGRYFKTAIMAAFLLAISPMFVFGVVYQLIAQVGGIALMIALASLLTKTIRTKARLTILLEAIPCALVVSALAVFYPEVSPFVTLMVLFFFFIEWYNSKRFPAARVVLIKYVLILFFILLRYNVISYIYSLSNQLIGGLRQNDLSLSLFPFFLIPSGIPSLVGLQAMNADLAEPWGSILILVAILVLVITTITALMDVYSAKPYAILMVIQGVVGLILFRSGNDFGTYKMAMYIQPVLMASFAAVLIRLKQPLVSSVIIVFISICMLKVDLGFTRSSAGNGGGIVAEVQNVSAALKAPPSGPAKNNYWISSIDNMIAAKLAAQVYRGGYVKFPSRDLFPVSAYLIQADWPLMKWYPHREVYDIASKLMDMRNNDLYIQGSVFGTEFSEPKASLAPTHYLSLTSNRNLFNKLHPDGKTDEDFFVVKSTNEVKNFIIFVHSSLGSHYYLGDRKNISFYQQESDYFDSTQYTNAMGRFFLLRIENPSKEVYLRLNVSKTLMAKDRKSWSSQALVKAQKDVPIPFVGSGAANLYVGPLTPVKVGDAYYLALDMGEGARAFPSHRSGLKALYNQDIPLDYRWLISYGRDISVISPEEYLNIERPTHIENFPHDIVKSKGFEFSGIYEDGWISPDSRYVLGKSQPGDVVRMRFEITKGLEGCPAIGDAKVSVNGSAPLVMPVVPGRYDWLIPIKNPGLKTDVSVSFSYKGLLPSEDDRLVSAKLESIKIISISKVDLASVSVPKPPTNGIDNDGWCESRAVFDMPVNTTAKGVVLTIDYPGWWNVPATSSLKVHLDNLPPHVFILKQGRNKIIVDAPAGVSMRRVYLESDASLSLHLPDGRQRYYCLMYSENNDELYNYNSTLDSKVSAGMKVDYATTGANRPPTEGVNSDGWANRKVLITLPITRDSNSVIIDIDYPGWRNLPKQNRILISIDGEKGVPYILQQGSNHIVLNAPVGFRVRTISLEAEKTFVMPALNDQRECSYRLISVQSN
jgi:hypothetical protein